MGNWSRNFAEIDQGAWDRQWGWDGLAIGYVIGSYGLGLGLILAEHGWKNALGVILLTHSLVLSAYLAHEFMHGNLFAQPHWNEISRTIMLWLNGGCYVRFAELRHMHLAHHLNRIDYCRFDIPEFLQTVPAWIRSILLGLEWLYIPALAFLLRIRLIFAPFYAPDRRMDRLRTATIFTVRALGFAALACLSVKAILLYFLAYLGMMHLLRLMDAFQHTYASLPQGVPIPDHHRNMPPEVAYCYEQENTFSNVISKRYEWLNLLLLNFGYHNAHHEVIYCPWYHLPALNRALYGNVRAIDQSSSPSWSHSITLLELIGNYHRFRVSRILTGQGEVIDPTGDRRIDTFYGATEVSFLVVPV